MKVISVNISTNVHPSTGSGHRINKKPVDSIKIIAGYGVEGDRHAGKTVQHIWDKKKNPEAPNLRQVHLMHQELFDEMKAKGYAIQPGEMGENVTTTGIDILNLPEDTILHLGPEAKIQIKGLRKPCSQLNNVQDGLLNEMVADGDVPYLTGVMAIAIKDGEVSSNDEIKIVYPEKPFKKLKAV